MRAARHSLISGTTGAALALAATLFPATHQGMAFSGLFSIDGLSVFMHVVVGRCPPGGAGVGRLPGPRAHLDAGEYYALVLFATAGMGVMASATELMTAFVGLEVSSISTYILAGYRRDAPRSNESAMKYFLLGSFATAFFLYGIAMILARRAPRSSGMPR